MAGGGWGAKGGSLVEGGREGNGTEEERSASGGEGSEADTQVGEARGVAGEKQENGGEVGRLVRKEAEESVESRVGRGESDTAVGDSRGSSLTGSAKAEEKAEADADAKAEAEVVTEAKAEAGAEGEDTAAAGAEGETNIASGGGNSLGASRGVQGQPASAVVKGQAGDGCAARSEAGAAASAPPPPTDPSTESACAPSHQSSALGTEKEGSDEKGNSGEKRNPVEKGDIEMEAGEASMDGESEGEEGRVNSNVVEAGGGSQMGAAPLGGLAGGLSDKEGSFQVKTAGAGVEQVSLSAAADGRQIGTSDSGGNKIEETWEAKSTAGDGSRTEDSRAVDNRNTVANGGTPTNEDGLSSQPNTTAEVPGIGSKPDVGGSSSSSSSSSRGGGDASSTATGNKETGTSAMGASGTATEATASNAVGNNGALISGAQVVTSASTFSISSSGSSFAGAASNLYGLKSLMHMVRQWEDKQAVLEQYVEDMAASYAANLASTDDELLSLRTRLRNATVTIAGLQVQMQNAEQRHGKELEEMRKDVSDQMESLLQSINNARGVSLELSRRLEDMLWLAVLVATTAGVLGFVLGVSITRLWSSRIY
ncbi:unnamed protein product [Closterium sp. NIES-53]